MIISIVGELLHDCSWCCKTQFINRRKQQQNHSLDLEIKTVHLFPLKMHHCFVFKWGCDFHGKNNLFLCNQNERNDYHQGEFIRRAKGLFEQKTFRAEAIALPARGRQCSHCTCFYILHSIHFPSNSLQLLRRKMIACHGSWEQAVILLLMWALCREKGAATFCQRGQQHKTIKGKIWGSLRNVKNGESKKKPPQRMDKAVAVSHLNLKHTIKLFLGVCLEHCGRCWNCSAHYAPQKRFLYILGFRKKPNQAWKHCTYGG